MKSSVRCFVGVALHGETVQEIVNIQRELAVKAPGEIRWQPSERLHGTLRFLGEVPEESTEGISNALAAACVGTPAPGLTLTKLICWPPSGAPKYVTLNLGKPHPGLDALQARISEAVAPYCSVPAEPFDFHITLGTIVATTPVERELWDSWVNQAGPKRVRFEVRSLDFVQTNSGHVTLARFSVQ